MAKGKAVSSKGPKVSAIKLRNISQTKASNKRKKATGKAKNKSSSTQVGKNASGGDGNLGNLGSDGEDVEEEVVPDDMVDDDHMEYLETMGQNISFVTDTLDEKKEERNEKKRRKDDQDEVADYEELPRKQFRKMETEDRKYLHLLPIKGDRGIIPQMMEKTESDEEDVIEQEEDKEENVEKKSAVKSTTLPETLSEVELLKLKKETLARRKMQIAKLSIRVMDSPQEALSSLKALRVMLNEEDPQVAVTVRKLVMLSLCEVFKDIAPGYHIRTRTDKETQQKMKKDVKQMVEWEEGLVRQYQLYLQHMEDIIKACTSKKKAQGVSVQNKLPMKVLQSLMEVAVKCMCELLVSLMHFNFRTNIMSVIVPLMDSYNSDIADLCCDTVKKVFKQDRQGDSTMEVVKLITGMVKSKAFSVQSKVLETFLALKIKMVFLTYFRILKKNRQSVLLPSVLEGLAKFSHLINVEFFNDLITVLRELVESGNLSYRETLHCMVTAFQILSNQGGVLNIDPLRFYTHLYANMLHLHAGQDTDDTTNALECIDIMLNKRRKQVSMQRAFAFLKRLCTLSLQLLPNSTLGALAASREFLKVFPKTDMLLQIEETQGGGMYLPELQEPEHCNAHTTALWELHHLNRHYHPHVRRYAAHLLRKAPSEGAGSLPPALDRKSPSQLSQEFDPSEMNFNPSIPGPGKGGKNMKPFSRLGSLVQESMRKLEQDVCGDAM
ncbi:NOC3L [Branchiostoma lanceolatum]|uniref:Nucleolar complex protein 3 homolog n=1 Tax=Branchiostoma lanceolatum TaxID=7740 RepID=A0A8K0EJI4_BRALA|nr:NOC3L [Branchiostoma lanceolatum]